jgi:hypothetical protein
MVKSILSVVAGYVAWTAIFLGSSALVRSVMSDVHDSEGFTTDISALLIYLILSIVASLAAGFVTARLAPRRMTRHAFVLAILLLATGIPVQLASWDKLPLWYNVAFLAMLMPATLAGVRFAGPELID